MAPAVGAVMVNSGPAMPDGGWINCPRCGVTGLLEVTTLEQAHPRYLCLHGHHFQYVPFTPAPSMAMVPFGPVVPTPEDILMGAGLDPGLWR